MSPSRFLLIAALALVAAAVTVWIGAPVAARAPVGSFALVPVALVALVGWRLVAGRRGSGGDRPDRLD